VFFPAFIFGHLYGKQILEALPQYRVPLSVLFISVFMAAVFISDYIGIRWLWGSHPYSNMPFDTPSIGYRAVMLASGIIASISLFALLPAHSRPLALLGRETMPVYLLHGLPVMLFWTYGLHVGNDILFVVGTAVLSLIISFSIAASSFYARWINPSENN
jgi:fucose 4-O-acetylase-like acetyltransferase